MLRSNERVLAFPEVAPTGPFPEPKFSVAPGKFLAQMDPPLVKTKSGIMLRSLGRGFSVGGGAEAMRADCATVLRLGPLPNPGHPHYGLAFTMHQQLTAGDRVILTPYVNRFASLGGIRDAHIAGLDGDEWLDTTIMKAFDEASGDWQLLGNWVAVRLNRRMSRSAWRGRMKWEYEDWGEVVGAGPDASVDPGQNVVVLGKSRRIRYGCQYFVAPKSKMPEGTIFFRESSFVAGKRHGTVILEKRLGAVIGE